jgi:hypothetical protein
MHQADALTALSSTAGATREPTTRSKTVYAADMSDAKPLSVWTVRGLREKGSAGAFIS